MDKNKIDEGDLTPESIASFKRMALHLIGTVPAAHRFIVAGQLVLVEAIEKLLKQMGGTDAGWRK